VRALGEAFVGCQKGCALGGSAAHGRPWSGRRQAGPR
jgi:hypothetical protein